jgi:hypothetical protein
VSIDPGNADLVKQYSELQLDIKDEQAEADVMRYYMLHYVSQHYT